MSDLLTFYSGILQRIDGFLYRCAGPAQQYRMLIMTEGVERLTGYRVSDFLEGGTTPFSSINLDHEAVARQVVEERHFENRTNWDVRYRIRKRDGGVVHVHEVGRALYDPASGEIIYLEGAVVEASILHDAQEKRDRQRQRLDDITDRSGAILQVLSQLKMLAFNARIEAQRAGADGLGFTVIATEMKDIARKAQDLVEKIEAEHAAITTKNAA
jgi:hypothetical protein